jgi:ketosteroid isomerase-like protein
MERSAEVEQAVNELYDALQSGDIDTFASRLTDDAVVIGTDPDEWWQGRQAIAQAFGAQSEAMEGGFNVEPGDIVGYALGDVGWFSARSAFVVEQGKVPFRHTGVLVRDGGGWKTAQSHVSIGVPNEEAMGQELPT